VRLRVAGALALGLVVDFGVVLRVVVPLVVGALGPVVAELPLRFPAAEPVEAHVHRLRALGHDGVVGDADGGGVVGLDGRARLRPSHFLEGLADRDELL